MGNRSLERRNVDRAAARIAVAVSDPVQLELDRRTCNGKVRFATRAAAKGKAKLTKRLKGSASVYACNVCAGFHVSSWTREDARRYRRGAR